MYYIASLVFAFVVSLIFVSKVAEMLLAKRFSIPWIFLASLAGIAASAAIYLLLSIFIHNIDPMVMMIVSLSVMFLVFSGAFKYINKMSWSSAITTGVANIASILIGVTAAVVLNGESIDKTFSSVTQVAKNNTTMVKAVAMGEELPVEALAEDEELVSDSLEEEFIDENALPIVKEVDLLLPEAIKEITKKDKKVFIEPKYHVINVGSIHSFVGKPIRILKSNGSIIAGSLKKINGSNAIVAQRMYSGVATIPVSITSIRKLEVYR